MPYIFEILFAIKPSLRDLMIGTPPQTDASNSKFTLFFSAILDKISPYFAIKALLAVTTCFLFFNALNTNFLAAPSAPPINSTIRSTSYISWHLSNSSTIGFFLS